MSKQIAMIPLSHIDRVAIVFGNGRSMAQVKGGTGTIPGASAEKFQPDYIMNAGFYDMTTGKPVGHLKAGGTVYAKEKWTSWGYAWGTGGDIAMEQLPARTESYLSGVPILTPWDSVDAKLIYPAEVGGARPRTAMALAGDKLILYCTDSPTTPEKLREELHRLGAETAIMLDSGGSSQCDFQGRTISSSRRVNNYIAVWLKKSGGDPGEGESKMSKKVVLDPGHGVETAGKRSPDGTYLEHEFALDMAGRIKVILERHGVEAVLTRSDEHDVSLAKRVEIANAAKPDLFVSLHSNASGDGSHWMSARGYGVYTSAAGDTAGRNIAACKLIARANEAGFGLWGEGLHHDISLYVLKNTVAPAVLIEHLFHDNREDVELLKDAAFRDKLAKVDAKGILDYLDIPYADGTTEEPQDDADGIACPYCGGRLKIEKG